MKVYKFDLPLEDIATIRMPKNAQVLYVAVQDGIPRVWALVSPTAPKETRNFRVAGTGHPIGKTVGRHIGSFQMHDGALVFHVFEL
jgi:hypothetical protein